MALAKKFLANHMGSGTHRVDSCDDDTDHFTASAPRCVALRYGPLTVLALLLSGALTGCAAPPSVGRSTVGPRDALVIVRVEVDQITSLEDFCRNSPGADPDGFDLEDAHRMGTHPERIQTVVSFKLSVSAPSSDIAFAVADWWQSAAQVRKAGTADGLARCEVWSGSELLKVVEPMNVSQPMTPVLDPQLDPGAAVIARVNTFIGVGCSASDLALLTLVEPSPTRDDWRWQVPWTSAINPHAPLTVPPYDAWRYESLSPIVQFVVAVDAEPQPSTNGAPSANAE